MREPDYTLAPAPETLRVHDARVALDRAQRTPGAQTTNLAGSFWLAQQAERGRASFKVGEQVEYTGDLSLGVGPFHVTAVHGDIVSIQGKYGPGFGFSSWQIRRAASSVGSTS